MNFLTNDLSPTKNTTPIYVVDFLNIFSDYREIKYKKENVDFHSVKHANKEIDTLSFFELFFTKYIDYAKINTDSNFIFILKKISNYEKTLIKVLESYPTKNIRFIIIESKYTNQILDKNKDDFLCQYLFCFLMQNNDNCIMISNDKYRDLDTYMRKFDNTFIRVLKLTNGLLDNQSLEININENSICNLILSQHKKNYKRCTIPKKKLLNIL